MTDETERLTFGKKIKGALYIHKDSVPLLNEKQKDRLEKALAIVDPTTEYNVVKIEKGSVSLLAYEDFEAHAFPALKYSTHVDLNNETFKEIDFAKRENPPILHRKELLLPPHHPKIPEYLAITRLAESKNLFAEPTKIGFKQKWFDLLDSANLKVTGPKLLEKDTEHAEVLRHRTALMRRDLSQPVQLLLLNGILDKDRTFFDYGCGQGTDFNALLNSGYESFGWDPHHLPEGKRGQADVVNLGFVLNVIEDTHERLETLIAAWRFAKKALCVAVMVSGKIDLNAFKPYRDGVLTSRNTFQKYFSQQEIRDYVAEATGATPISLAPGIVSVFKDKSLEQDVAFKRSMRSLSTLTEITVPRILTDIKSKQRIALIDMLAEEISLLWTATLDKGRLIDPVEFPLDLIESLKSKRVSPLRLLDLVRDKFVSAPQFKLAEDCRREDLVVHLALGFFPGSKRSDSYSESLSKDIRYFFGTQKRALSVAKEELFRAGNLASVEDAIHSAILQQLGAMKDKDTFRCCRASVDTLPLVLRLIVQCAGVLRGGTDGVDYLDIKTNGKSVSFLTCFDAQARFPVVSENNLIDLSKQRSRIDMRKGVIIYQKSKYMISNDPSYESQLEIDAKIEQACLLNDQGEGPDWFSLKKLLSQANKHI